MLRGSIDLEIGLERWGCGKKLWRPRFRSWGQDGREHCRGQFEAWVERGKGRGLEGVGEGTLRLQRGMKREGPMKDNGKQEPPWLVLENQDWTDQSVASGVTGREQTRGRP